MNLNKLFDMVNGGKIWLVKVYLASVDFSNMYLCLFPLDCKLVGKTFYEVKGRVFCEKDYEVKFFKVHSNKLQGMKYTHYMLRLVGYNDNSLCCNIIIIN